jgi:hypothetical protein
MADYQSAGFIQRHRGALLFVDISGFTELSQKFNVEDFKNFINDYFTKIIELVNNFGGEVVKFAGDALIAIWITAGVPYGFENGVSGKEVDASHALNVEKCTSCAIAINVEVSQHCSLLLNCHFAANASLLTQLNSTTSSATITKYPKRTRQSERRKLWRTRIQQ